jgi:hypothetical protein
MLARSEIRTSRLGAIEVRISHSGIGRRQTCSRTAPKGSGHFHDGGSAPKPPGFNAVVFQNGCSLCFTANLRKVNPCLAGQLQRFRGKAASRCFFPIPTPEFIQQQEFPAHRKPGGPGGWCHTAIPSPAPRSRPSNTTIKSPCSASINANGTLASQTIGRSGGFSATEVACWACWCGVSFRGCSWRHKSAHQ